MTETIELPISCKTVHRISDIIKNGFAIIIFALLIFADGFSIAMGAHLFLMSASLASDFLPIWYIRLCGIIIFLVFLILGINTIKCACGVKFTCKKEKS